MALLAVTSALAPIAVVLVRLAEFVDGPEFTPRAVLLEPVVLLAIAPTPSAVLLLPVVLNESAVEPVAVFHVESFEVVEFPENPRKAFPLLKEPKAKGLPPRLKLVEAPMTPPPTIPVALRFPVTLWFPLKLLATV